MLPTILNAAFFFAGGVVAHLTICRLLPSGKFMRDGLLTGGGALLAVALWQVRSGTLDPVALYLLLTAWLAYLMFFINLLNSVTLKMLERLAAASGGTLQEPDFAKIFNEEAGLKARLSDMESNGFIRREGTSLLPTGKARRFLYLVALIRKMISA